MTKRSAFRLLPNFTHHDPRMISMSTCFNPAFGAWHWISETIKSRVARAIEVFFRWGPFEDLSFKPKAVQTNHELFHNLDKRWKTQYDMQWLHAEGDRTSQACPDSPAKRFRRHAACQSGRESELYSFHCNLPPHDILCTVHSLDTFPSFSIHAWSTQSLMDLISHLTMSWPSTCCTWTALWHAQVTWPQNP